METIIIIALGIVTLILIGRLALNKARKNISNPSSKEKFDINNKIESLMNRASEKEIVKDYKSAIAITDQILLLNPNHYDALTNRARCLEALNFNIEAIEDYERALSFDNSDALIYGLLGLTYRKIGDLDNGQKNLKISIQKGLKLFEGIHTSLLKASEGAKQMIIEKTKKPENLLRRNPNDFVDNLSEIDKKEFKKCWQNNIEAPETATSIDPNNTQLKKLYEFAKSQYK